MQTPGDTRVRSGRDRRRSDGRRRATTLLAAAVVALGAVACATSDPDDVGDLAASPAAAEEPDDDAVDEIAEEADDGVEAEPGSVIGGSQVTGVLAFESPAEGQWPRWSPTCPYLDVDDVRYVLQAARAEGEGGVTGSTVPGSDPPEFAFVEVTADGEEGDVVARGGDTVTIVVDGVDANEETQPWYSGCEDAAELLWFGEFVD